MNILITGGAGYIGTELIETLKADSEVDKIVVYDNLSRKNYNLFLGKEGAKSDRIRFVKGDILDSRKLKQELKGIDTVIHLAGKVTTPFADHNPHEFDQVNNWGSAELSYLIEESDVSRVIYASSVSVYGASPEEQGLTTVLHPKTFYGISKMHGEEHIRRMQKPGLDVYILRIGNVYGYNRSMRFDSVINKFMFEANFTGRLKIFGDGNQARSFIHVETLSEIIKDFAFSKYQSDTYNVVEDTFTVNDIVDEMKSIYPNLEMIFVSQNVEMRSLKVTHDERIPLLNPPRTEHLKNDLEKFKERFRF